MESEAIRSFMADEKVYQLNAMNNCLNNLFTDILIVLLYPRLVILLSE